MEVRDFGLFVAKIVPNVITPSAWVSAVAVRQQFVIITQPLLCTGTLGTVGVSWVSAYRGSDKALCEANHTYFCEPLLH